MQYASIPGLALALALGSALAAGPALAAPPEGVRWQMVRVGDLDLATEQGAQTALRRLRDAAHDVCTDGYSNARFERTSASYQACVHKALSTAIGDLRSPLVTAHYNGGKPVQIARK